MQILLDLAATCLVDLGAPLPHPWLEVGIRECFDYALLLQGKYEKVFFHNYTALEKRESVQSLP